MHGTREGPRLVCKLAAEILQFHPIPAAFIDACSSGGEGEGGGGDLWYLRSH